VSTSDKQKVLAYITQGNKLLVFKHADFPEAGIQVPAGTVEPGERLEDAVIREACEETGLSDLVLVSFLGYSNHDLARYGLDRIDHRYFYHLICRQECPATWRHHETNPSEGDQTSIAFDFYWVSLPHGVPELSGEQGQMLDKLLASLRPEL
jgi:8-oxo-dGTP diphosphatase